jgi:acetolactate synthase-1/2/3 large subunit
MKISDYVIATLEARGVGHVFMLPGGGCMHLVDSVGTAATMKFVATLHEQGAAIAADAYAQFTNGYGLALVTTGPGGTNAVTGLAASWNDSIPVVFLSGQVKRADLMRERGVRMMGPQEVDVVALVSSMTKYAVTVLDPNTIRYHLEKALFLARHGRPGPVWLDVPLDIQAIDVDPAALPGFDPATLDPVDAPDLDALVAEVVAALQTARRPAVLVGNGVRLAGAEGAMRALAQRLRARVLTTWKTVDLVADDDPLFAGRPGGIASRGANFTQQSADCLLVLGARLDLPTVGFNPGRVAPNARRIIVDVDRNEIAKLGWGDALAVVADAGSFLAKLNAALEGVALPDWSAWVARTQAWRKRYPVVLPEYWAETDGVSIYALVDALSDLLGEGDAFVPGSSGACSEVSSQAFRPRAGVRFLNSQGLGAMGFGVPAALGAAVASGGRRTVCVDGDGGFQMNLQELETIRRLALPVKFFVLDNNGYGSIRATQKAYFEGRLVACDPSSGLTLPDTRRVAEAYGIPSSEITVTAGLREAVRAVLDRPGPEVCVVRVCPSQSTQPRASSRRLPDGSMVTAPIEDLAPFLPRDELAENLRVEDGA